ncbi:nuclear factor 7, brain-like [Echeneis naucrates]|uniref:Nuclear factor 7, brain-like n=1 Tax=Echeneis naucrates TaxID=173247 RepID=A0A665WDJ4_ECHNA|nr:nuclear factor 7, brain-like [Echeneis naucrates]
MKTVTGEKKKKTPLLVVETKTSDCPFKKHDTGRKVKVPVLDTTRSFQLRTKAAQIKMASNVSILSEEQLLCPICLDLFTQPVSTPCGHNFCATCLTCYWDSEPICQCPICKEKFDSRPKLKVNTFISELVSQFALLQVAEANTRSPDLVKVNSGSTVLCDICTDGQQEAVKSCMECLTSYCSVHLEPHYRAAGLKRHQLVEAQLNLEDRICKQHSRLLEMFCICDRVLLCNVCTRSQHVNHDVVPMQQAHKEMKDLLGDSEEKVEQMIQERLQKVRETAESVKQSKKETKDAIANCVKDLTALVSEIQESQTELVKVVEEKQKAAEEGAGGFISTLEQELTELQKTATKLRELKQTEDAFHFLQNVKKASLLPIKGLPTFSFTRHLEIKHMEKCLSSSVSQLRTLLRKMNTDMFTTFGHNLLVHLQQYEVNIFLDPDTAHPLLILSEDRKSVRYSMGSGLWGIQNLKPNMFIEHLAVLGHRGFSSGKLYFEVLVSRKTEWCLGVATASIQRKGLVRSPHSGLWAIWFLEDKFETFSSPGMTVYLGTVDRVGVFVDYEGDEVSFYDVHNSAVIYSFTDCFFNEQLYPYLNPCDNEYGSNLDPMVIVPVSRTEEAI